jgi:membrane protease YdiL (CAAX protease family)/NAD-dependent dihydropyrimidine dehydrogenase PreA subunit
MSPAPRLTLNPRLCDRCGRCLEACERNAIKVGRTYIMVDWNRCDGCGDCATVCDCGAIARRDTPGRPAPKPRSAAGPKPVSAAATPRARSATPKAGSRGGFQWTLLEAAAMLSVTFSAFMVKEALSASQAISTLPSALAIPARVGVLGVYYAIQVAVLLWLVRRRDGDVSHALGLRGAATGAGRALASVGLVVAGLAATRTVASLYAYVTREIGLMPTTGSDLPTLFGSDTTGLVLAVAMVVVIGPVVEEMVFRAALLEGLAARMGVWPAIMAQALLFAAFHRSLWLLFPTFALGVVLGWLAHQRESLWPAIALHALYNAITVAAAFLVTSGG